MILNYIIQKKEENRYLKTILKEQLYISNTLLNKLKESNLLIVNGESKFANYKVKNSDCVSIDLSKLHSNKKFSNKFKLTNSYLEILYEDEYLLIINKPYNMAIHPSCNNYTNTLSNIVASYLEKQNIHNIHVITRLDKNTSGICIFAKNEYIQELFNKKNITIKKEYICIVNNLIQKNHGIIEENIARKKGSIILREVNFIGDYAKTEYFTMSRNLKYNYSVLKIILHTGKTHQIRVHMNHISHTLLGDDLYAKNTEKLYICNLINRQALHSYKISFDHPINNKYIEISANLPVDMQNLITHNNI